MMPRITRSERYLQDLSSIVTYIAEQSGSRSVAKNLYDSLDQRVEQYARQPEMGTLCEDLLPGLRCFTFKKNYVVFYQEMQNGIDLIRVLHGAREIDVDDFIS